MRIDKCVRHTQHDYLIVLGQAPDIAISVNCHEAKPSGAKDLKSMSAFGIKGNTYKLHENINASIAPTHFAGTNRF